MNQFFLEQLAYIARKLDAIQEGERTLLDNTMLLSLLEHDGTARSTTTTNCPSSCSAAAAAESRADASSTITDKPERQMCRLFLSLMDKMDVHPKTFGDAKTMLEEI